jgi:mono/diheme cytochrome c family protein
MRHLGIVVLLGGILLPGSAQAQAGVDVEKGRKIAITHCARCHVVGDYNRFGGIDSTPSFQMLARRDYMEERMRTFYERRPHPAFVTVPGVPKWSKSPPYATPFTVLEEEIDHLVAFVKTLKSWKRPPRRRRR